MKHFSAPISQTISRRLWTTSMAVLTGAYLALQPQWMYASDITPPPVPTGLEVPAGHRPFLLGHATGTQNYICLFPGSDSPWVFVGPQATLFNDDHIQIITHFLSPNPDEPDGGSPGRARATWQHSQDTSAIWAKMITNSADAAFVKPRAIPWLLLQRVGADPGPTKGHRLTETAYIQRVHTSGGLAPTTGCDQAPDIGKRAFVPYTADYIFYKKAARHK